MKVSGVLSRDGAAISGKGVDMKTALFVCVHNSGRSQMAEALFNRLAEGRFKAVSAGTAPADTIDPTVVEAMTEAGMDISGKKPELLTPEMMESADRVVTMGCGVETVCPSTLVESEDWWLEAPKGKPIKKVREIRDEIRTRVEKILEELESS